MTVASLFERREWDHRQFVLYTERDDPTVVDRFEARNADVERRRCPIGGRDGFVVVRSDDRFLGALSLGELEAVLEPPVAAPWELNGAHEAHRKLFGLLEDTLFVSLDERRVLVAAREVEEHAWRVGAGGLHAGFRSADVFAEQRSVYERLARETDLDVHVYSRPAPEDAPSAVTVHTEPADVVDGHRFLVFDGSGDDTRKCALLARPREESTYAGFWTYDPVTADAVLEAIRPGE